MPRLRSLITIVGLHAAAGLAAPPNCADLTSTCALVLDVTGTWHGPGGVVKPYRTLELGSELACDPKDKTALVQLWSRGASISLTCTSAATLVMPRPQSGKEALTGWRALIANVVAPESIFAPAHVRAVTSPVDSVIPISDQGRIDVSATLAQLKPGPYRLRFRSFSPDDDSVLARAEVNWTGQGAAELSSPKLSRGLYWLDVSTGDDLDASVGTCAVLISPAAAYPARAAALAGRRASAGPELTPASGRALDILLLAALAQ